MKHSKRLTKTNSQIFAALLTVWSWSEQSFFLHEFYEAFGMNIDKFYKHLYRALDDVPEFNYEEIKKRLMDNRYNAKKEIVEKVIKIKDFSQNQG